MFVLFKRTKEEFIAERLDRTHENDIVAIKGDANGDGACFYTKGVYVRDFSELGDLDLKYQPLLSMSNKLPYSLISGTPDLSVYALKTAIPTKLSQLTDDVVAGNYLSTKGGTVNGNVTAPKFIGEASTVADGAVTLAKVSDSVKASLAKADESASLVYVNTELGKKATLVDGKIAASDLPDFVLGQVTYGGIIQSADPTLLKIAPSGQFISKYGDSGYDKEGDLVIIYAQDNSGGQNDYRKYNGVYFISNVKMDGSFAGQWSFEIGDWIISNGISWGKVDNTDAVTSVAGLTGNVTVTSIANALTNAGYNFAINSFTNDEKAKLAGIEAGAQKNVQSDWRAGEGDAAILNKPWTLAGYGITDAYTKAEVDGKGFLLATTAESTYQTKITSSSKLAYSLISGTPDLSVYALKTAIPTKLSQLTDDVVKGKYLSLAGGTINGSITATSFIGNLTGNADSASVIKMTTNTANTKPNDSLVGLNAWYNNSGENMPAVALYSGITVKRNASHSVWEIASQDLTYPDVRPLYFRRGQGDSYTEWKQIAFTDSNVASATKLATKRLIYGMDFEGNNDICGDENAISIEDVNAIDDDANNWNSKYSLRMWASNNAMTFMVGSTQNERKGMIQVGHAAMRYSQYLGTLLLNPLGGNVAVGGKSADARFHVHGNARIEGDIEVTGKIKSTSAHIGAYEEVPMTDNYAIIEPNKFYKWGVVSGTLQVVPNTTNSQKGVANEYLFQFSTGNGISLQIDGSIKWGNYMPTEIKTNMTYQVSIIDGLASIIEYPI